MKTQFTLFKRKSGIFYMKNKLTGQHKSLKTRDRAEAQKLVQAHNDVVNQAYLNLELAKVYLSGSDPQLLQRTWQDVMDQIVQRRAGETKRRWTVAIQDENFDGIRNLKVVETRPEHFDSALADGKPSTNVYLRRIHNHALGMEWLLKSVLPKLLWPKPIFKKKRAITLEEHRRIVEGEIAAAQRNQSRSDEPHYDERRDFYEFLWHTGAAQSDAAFILAENINWQQRTLSYSRRKLATRDSTTINPALVRFGDGLAAVLERRPRTGPLFPYLRTVRPSDRATEFKQRCKAVGVEGVTLHCYRYGWAKRAAKCGYPERFSQQNLGHNSKAVHHAYAKNADVIVPSLEDWEAHWQASQQPGQSPSVPAAVLNLPQPPPLTPPPQPVLEPPPNAPGLAPSTLQQG
jgi:integrase